MERGVAGFGYAPYIFARDKKYFTSKIIVVPLLYIKYYENTNEKNYYHCCSVRYVRAMQRSHHQSGGVR
jgi:hypothetical protein